MLMLAALSDDQVALIGCAVALVFSFGLMSLTYVFGSARQNQQRPDTVQFPVHQVTSDDQQKRRAA